jgi:hypothetical protein
MTFENLIPWRYYLATRLMRTSGQRATVGEIDVHRRQFSIDLDAVSEAKRRPDDAGGRLDMSAGLGLRG